MRALTALGMNVQDYYPQGRRMWFRLHEKGGKRHEVPAHHNAEAYLDAYLQAAGITGEKNAPPCSARWTAPGALLASACAVWMPCGW